MVLPEKVSYIIEVFQNHGYEAYAVGGCVRDSLLGRTPDDWDITTNASPAEMKKLFRRTVDTGIEHGTVTVLLGKEGFEVTTYRIDGKYEDGRHPKEVVFTKSLIEDLKRRDFTINAMAYNEQEGLVDCFGGLSDLHAGIIRCVGKPQERFTEDALRILRCLRFSAQLGFSIDEATKEAVIRLAPSLRRISAERIQAEWNKLLTSPNPQRMQEAYDYGVLAQFFPEVVVDAELTAGVCAVSEEDAEKSMRFATAACAGEKAASSSCTDKAANDATLRCAEETEEAASSSCADEAANDAEIKKRLRCMRYAMMLRRLPPDTVYGMLRRLKYDNETVRTVTALVKYIDLQVEPTEAGVRRAASRTGRTLFVMLLYVWGACQRQEHLELITSLFARITARGDCLSLDTLAVKGGDLIARGLAPGKQIGETLQMLLERVLEHPEENERETLLAAAEKLPRA